MFRHRYDIEQIALRLLGEPNPHLSRGSDLRFGDRGSISVNIDKGVFYDFKTNEGGGPLQLIVSQGEAANDAEARSWLRDQGLVEPVHRASVPKSKKPEAQKKARALFSVAREIKGSVVETYLQRRAIDPALGQRLRFHPALFNAEVRSPLPAFLAPITPLDRPEQLSGIHRNWLTADGRKADVPTPKKILGVVNGGGVVLGKFNDSILVGEGIETTLSASALFGLPGVATLGASNMRRLEVPATVLRVVIAFDRDANRVGRQAAEALAERIWIPGRQIEFAGPPAGFKDFNDAAQAAARGAAGDDR